MKFIYSIAVARHTKHLGFTGVRMNLELIPAQTFYTVLHLFSPSACKLSFLLNVNQDKQIRLLYQRGAETLSLNVN